MKRLKIKKEAGVGPFILKNKKAHSHGYMPPMYRAKCETTKLFKCPDVPKLEMMWIT